MIVCLGPTDLRLGRLELLRGCHQAAEAHLEQAIAIASRMGARPYLAEARFARAVLLARRGSSGDRTGALVELDAALDLARAVGMTPLVDAALALALELRGPSDARDGQTLSLDPSNR
jgi:hypothetical protein